MEKFITSFAGFIICFLIIFLYYKFLVIKKDEKMDKKKLPAELKLFLYKNNVNLRKRSYKEIMKDLSILIAFDIATAIFIVNIDNILLRVIFTLVVLYILYKLSIYVMVCVYKKKGYIENGKN